MLDFTTAAVIGLLLLAAYLYVTSFRADYLPPGPDTKPLIGNLDLVYNNKKLHLTIHELVKKYGNVFSLQLGKYPVIFISDLNILMNQVNSFSDRPADNPFIKMIFNQKGLLFQNGSNWKKLRGIALQTFHKLGIKGNTIQLKIEGEIKELVARISSRKDNFSSEVFNEIISNLMCDILFGKRYDYDDPQFVQLLDDFKMVFADAGFQNVFHFLPVVLFPLIPFVQLKNVRIVAACRRLLTNLQQSIADHRKTFDPDNIKDFVDAYLEAEKRDLEQNPNSQLFCNGQLLQVIVDLIATGAETSSTLLDWTVYFLITYDDIQEQCREEIFKVCGKENPPTFKDRFSMPFVEATLFEVLRLSNIASLPPMRENPEEMTINGYRIPAKSIIIQNIYSIHMGEKYFDEPEKFKPERFLDASGNLVKSDALVPFGLGKRSCLGENMARMEVLIIISTILQKYRLKGVGKLPDLSEAEYGLTMKLPKYRIKAIDVEE